MGSSFQLAQTSPTENVSPNDGQVVANLSSHYPPVSGTPVHDSNRQTIEHLAQCINERSTSGIDLAGFAQDKTVLILADTHHGDVSLQSGLVGVLPHIRNLGFDAIAMELPCNFSVDDARQSSSGTRIPHIIQQFQTAAIALGFTVHYVDMSTNDPRQNQEHGVLVRERGIHMGEAVANLVQQGKRVALVTGAAHVDSSDQIRAVLQHNQIPYAAVHAYRADQPIGSHGLGGRERVQIFTEPLLERFRALQPTLKSATVHLDGTFTSDGVVIFPRIRAGEEAPTYSLDTSALSVPNNFYRPNDVLAAIPAPKPLSVNFQHCVEPDSTRWRTTNEGKIVDFCARMVETGNVTQAQAAFLASTLFSYAHQTGEHSLSGSILGMQYLPDGKVVRVTVVDLGGYTFNPDTDYRSLEKTYEVSFSTLDDRSGMIALTRASLKSPQLLAGPQNDLSSVLATDDPAAWIKLRALTLAVQADCGCVAVDLPFTRVVVYQPGSAGNVNGIMCQLSLSEFSMTELESRLLTLQSLGELFRFTVSNFRLHRDVTLLRQRESQAEGAPRSPVAQWLRNTSNWVRSFFKRSGSDQEHSTSRPFKDYKDAQLAINISKQLGRSGGAIDLILSAKAALGSVSQEQGIVFAKRAEVLIEDFDVALQWCTQTLAALAIATDHADSSTAQLEEFSSIDFRTKDIRQLYGLVDSLSPLGLRNFLTALRNNFEEEIRGLKATTLNVTPQVVDEKEHRVG